MTTKVAIIGSGNIGTDLTVKVGRSPTLEVAALVGIDPGSDGLARAAAAGIPTTAEGVDGLVRMPGFDEVAIVMDATSARAHVANAEALAPFGKRMIDLTPAALGPFVIPPVNLGEHLEAPDVNMVTCGGQATVPIVAAVASVAPVRYAEIVASIASRSAGPGTRANIDEFTETTARAIEVVGGAERGKAIIVLNPARPALLMRDTVLCVVDAEGEHATDPDAVVAAVQAMVAKVQGYVPGYRLKQAVQLRTLPAGESLRTLLGPDAPQQERLLVSVFLEVEGRGDYLPPFAGNLDIMTAAAVEVAEEVAARSARAAQPVTVGGAA